MDIFKNENYSPDFTNLISETETLKFAVNFKTMCAERMRSKLQRERNKKMEAIEKFCREEIVFVYCGKKKVINKHNVDFIENKNMQYLGAMFLRWRYGSVTKATSEMGMNNATFYDYNRDGSKTELRVTAEKMKADYKRLKEHLFYRKEIEFTGANFKIEKSAV